MKKKHYTNMQGMLERIPLEGTWSVSAAGYAQALFIEGLISYEQKKAICDFALELSNDSTIFPLTQWAAIEAFMERLHDEIEGGKKK